MAERSNSKQTLAPIDKYLPPIKKKKQNRKNKLENIRRNKHVTLIQAHWRGRLSRKVAPNAEKYKEETKEDDSNKEKDDKPESNSDREISNEKEPSPGFVPKILEQKNEKESNKGDPPDQPSESNEVIPSKYNANKKESIQMKEEDLIQLAGKQGDDGNVNYIKQSVIAVIMLLGYFTFGMIFYSKTLHISYFHALYFCVVTVTTIGYGEISPDTDVTKLLTAVIIFAGLATFTIGITFLLDFIAVEKEKLEEKLITMKFEEENKIEMDVQTGVEEDENEDENKDVNNEGFGVGNLCPACISDRIPEMIQTALKKLVVAILTIVITDLVGAIFVMFVVQDLNFVDAVYFCAVTISSVGYGDILPDTDRARVFIIFYGVIGTGMTANALTKFSDGVSCLINYQRAEEEEEDDEMGAKVFELMDSDGDGKVVKAEFMLYKLVRMGLVKPEHLQTCSEQFARLDFDGNGFLNQEDIDAFHAAVKKKKKKKTK